MIYSKRNQIGIGKTRDRVAIQIASWWKEAAIEKEPDKTQTCREVSSFLCSSFAWRACESSCLPGMWWKSVAQQWWTQRLSRGTENAIFL